MCPEIPHVTRVPMWPSSRLPFAQSSPLKAVLSAAHTRNLSLIFAPSPPIAPHQDPSAATLDSVSLISLPTISFLSLSSAAA